MADVALFSRISSTGDEWKMGDGDGINRDAESSQRTHKDVGTTTRRVCRLQTDIAVRLSM